MKVLTASCCVCWAVVLCCVPADGAEPPAEPEHAKLNTEDASPVDRGHFELELGYGWTAARREFGNAWGRGTRPYTREADYGLAFTYGLVEDLDVGLGVGYAHIYDRSTEQLAGAGLTDLELGLKWRFFRDEARRLEVAYVPALVLPTGRKENRSHLGTTDDFVSIFNGIALSKDWSDRLTSNLDVGYSWPAGEDRHDCRGTLSGDVAFGYQMTDWLQPELELNYAHDFNNGADADVLAATAGLIMPLHEHARLDVGVQRELAGRNADHAMSLLVALTLAY